MNENILLHKLNKYKVNEPIIINKYFYEENFKNKYSLSEFNEYVRQLCLANKLTRLTREVFYKPLIKKGQIVKIKESDIKNYFLKKGNGVVVNQSLFYEIGLSSIPSFHTKICIDKKIDKDITINNILLTYINIDLNKKSILFIKYLNILDSYSSIKDLNFDVFKKISKKVAKEYDDKIVNEIILRIGTTKNTIAFLTKILEAFKVKNTLELLLSENTKYKIPNIDFNLLKQ